MRFLLAVFLALPVHAQTQTGQTSLQPDVPPEVHQKTVQLVEVSGTREKMAASVPELIEQGKAQMRKVCPDCNPAFIEEWGKRMAARLKVDDFVNTAVGAYEKRFTGDELTELLAVVNSRKNGKPISPSPALQKKLSDLMPAITGEIVGRCTEIGAKLGGDIGAEIEKEHPEYAQPKTKPSTP